ncbi:hypothetical protein D3C72_573800 [compost metagenome]
MHIDAEGQLFVCRQRFEHAAQAIGQTRHAGVLRNHFELARLDLGDVQNVVDQVEQIVAGGVNRLGKLDLFGAEVVLWVLREQLGQNQRTVQRRAQFVGHVGEEFGLVLARALKLFGALFELYLSLIEFGVFQIHGVALFGQRLRLFGKLLVGLFQFDLLGFQMRLGFLENPRLLFQFFVGGFQLFLLHLQLFVELLGFRQHFLQTLTVARSFDGRTDVGGNQLQQFDIAIIERAQETQLDHTIDAVVIAGRHHQHTVRQAFAQPRADFEVVRRHRIQTDQPRLLRHLANNTFAAVDRLILFFLLAGETVSSHPLEAAVFFTHIQCGHGGAQILRAELQNIAPQQIQRQLPQHLLGQLGLTIAQPGLLLETFGTGLLRGKVGAVVGRQVDQITPADIGQQATDTGNEHQIEADAPDRGAAHVFIARGAQDLFGLDDVFELLADLVRQAFAASGLDRAPVVATGALQIDHRLGVIGPLNLQGLQTAQTIGLYRVVGGQFEQGTEGHRDARLGRFVRVEEMLVAAEQETTHAGFKVHGQLHRFVGVIDHPVGVLHPLDYRQQISDQRHEEHGTEHTDAQRQTDVATQEFAKPLLINRRRRGHGAALSNC